MIMRLQVFIVSLNEIFYFLAVKNGKILPNIEFSIPFLTQFHTHN